MPARATIAAVIAGLLAAAACAQPPAKGGTLLGEERRVRDELDVADRLAADKRYDDAVRRYQQVLAESGDALVSLAPAEPQRALPARWLVHHRLAALPPEARRLFRDAVEDAAGKWLDQGTAARDTRLLEQVVSQAFVTAPAEKALHLLGDLAFERGEFAVAEHYWRMLARLPGEEAKPPDDKAFVLLHPDAQAGHALVQAKLILALIFRGEKAAAKSELEHYRKRHAEAAGEFAGRSGKFADTLQALLDADTRLAPASADEKSWPTFAGDPARNRRIPDATMPYWRDLPDWYVTLPGDPAAKPHRDSDPPLGTGAAARSLAFHPVIVPGHVLVTDAARVFAYNLVDGKLAAEYDHRAGNALPPSLDLRVPSRTDAAHTLTVAGDRVYARFGAQPVKAPEAGNARPGEQESVIACLALRRGDAGSLKLVPRWQIRARAADADPPAVFEGAPLVHDGRLYVARTRFEGRQAIATVDCYDGDSDDPKGQPPARRWRQELWSAEAGAEPARHRHDLLTLAGPNVVYCTHSGAVVALDAATGRRAWAYRYPLAPPRAVDGVLPHDLCPSLYADGRVYAAPADADRILCLDARTGAKVWESNPTHVVQLLGASQGRLFATLGGFPQGLRAYHAGRGDVLWTKPDEGDRATFGRGFLSDRLVFWPTRRGVVVLRQDDGSPVYASSSAEPWGHLALGEGHLIVTTPTEIWGFVPPRARLGFRRERARERPDDAEAQYHLALAEADAGETDRAIAGFRRAAGLAHEGLRLHGRPLRELAEHRRFELLLQKANDAWDHGRKEASWAALREASGESFPAADRVRAIALRHHAGDPRRPDLLTLPQLRALWVTRRDGSPQRADEFLAGLLADDPVPPAPLAPKRRPPADSSSHRSAPDFPVPWTSRGIDLTPTRERPLIPFRDPAGDSGPNADDNGRVFFFAPPRLVCRALDTGRELWARDLDHDADEFGLDGDAVIVAGPDGVSRLRRGGGQTVWQFLAPPGELVPASFPDAPFRRLEPWPAALSFSEFRSSGPRLLFRHGPQKLLALDLEAGRVLWQFSAPGAPLLAPDEGAGLSGHYLATPDHVLLQSTAGELLALNAVNGRLLYRRPAPVDRTEPPLPLDARHAAYGDGPTLRAIELATGAERWAHTPPGLPSLSGAPPQARRAGPHLLLIVERNFGYDFERLSVDDGRLDLGPIFLGRERVDLSRSAITPQVYALMTEREVIALDRTTGERRWRFTPPAGGPWRLQTTRNALLLHPNTALPRTDPAWLARRAGHELSGLPTFAGVQAATNMLHHGLTRRSFPLIALAPASGKKLQEQTFSADGPRTVLWPGDQPAVLLDGRLELLKRD